MSLPAKTSGFAVVFVAAVIVSAAGVSSCARNQFTPASELGETPQVLAIRAEPPEVRPGETTVLEALVHWPIGTPALNWLLCIPGPSDDIASCVQNHFTPGVPIPACDQEPAAALCTAGQGNSATFTAVNVPAFDQALQLTFFVELVVSDAAVGLSGCEQAISEATPSDDCLLSLKRVVFSRSEAPNINPRLLHLTVNGQPADATGTFVIESGGSALEEFTVDVAAVADPRSIDEIWAFRDGPAPVDLDVAWFATCGSANEREGLIGTRQQPPEDLHCEPPVDVGGEPSCEPAKVTWKPEVYGTCLVHAVLVDGRYGTTFITQVMEIR